MLLINQERLAGRFSPEMSDESSWLGRVAGSAAEVVDRSTEVADQGGSRYGGDGPIDLP